MTARSESTKGVSTVTKDALPTKRRSVRGGRSQAATADAKPRISETDLYAPVRDLFTAQGYIVRGEVDGCDLVAVREERLVIVELKTVFNTALLIQATDRQRIADDVYIAIARPDKNLRSARWEGILHLLRRLELGLIFVRTPHTRTPGTPHADIVLAPTPYAPRRRARARQLILREASRRSADYNVGGSTRTALVTAYRERAVHIACCLAQRGDLSPRALRALGTGEQTSGILRRDVYGWFSHVARGMYQLTPAGHDALREFAHVAAPYLQELRAGSTTTDEVGATTDSRSSD